MNNMNNWLIAIGIIVLLGGGVYWLYGGQDKNSSGGNTNTNTNTNTTTATNTGDDANVPPAKLSQAVNDQDHTFGATEAKIQIVEYADYQCPACKALSPGFKATAEKYPDNVSFTYRHFPLSYHEKARPAALIAEAAAAQGKFWEMGDWLFANDFTIDSAYEHAASLGLDVDRMKSEIESGMYDAKVDGDYQSGVSSQVPGTPTLFLNGELLDWEKTQNLDGTIQSLINQ